MTNRQMFNIANRTDDDALKLVIRDRFLLWCHKNGRYKLDTQSIIDWFSLEWKG